MGRTRSSKQTRTNTGDTRRIPTTRSRILGKSSSTLPTGPRRRSRNHPQTRSSHHTKLQSIPPHIRGIGSNEGVPQRTFREGIHCESNSPYASSFFFRKKKDGKLRPIMDYRPLNSWTVRDTYPLPLINTILEQLQGKKIFTKFDIRWGYNNIRIREEDQWAAAFKTPFGLFQPRVMFFGLTNSPATFSHAMNRMF